MKIICSKSNLLYGVNIVSKAVPTRTTMAILECILIDASAGEIKLTANDMELGIETKIEGEIEERGIIALDAKVFSDIVRKLPDNEVVIETDSSFKTTITCEKAKFNIIGKSGEDFSYIPYIERNEEISISQFTLKEVIRQTIFSIADNDNNKLMTGELFEINENSLKVVSLDGHRISIRNIELKNNYEHKKVVVPGKTLQEISKILPGNADEDVSMYLSDNHIVFEFGNTTVVHYVSCQDKQRDCKKGKAFHTAVHFLHGDKGNLIPGEGGYRSNNRRNYNAYGNGTAKEKKGCKYRKQDGRCNTNTHDSFPPSILIPVTSS